MISLILSHIYQVSTSGFDGHIATSGCPSMTHLLVDTFFEFGVIENCIFRSRFTVMLTSESFGCELQLWALDDDILLLPVLSIILKV